VLRQAVAQFACAHTGWPCISHMLHALALHRPFWLNSSHNWTCTNTVYSQFSERIWWKRKSVHLCLWSSGQSSWPQIQRHGFDSRLYQIFWEVADLERENTAMAIHHIGHVAPSIRKVGTILADKWRSLGRYSSLMDSDHGVFLNALHDINLTNASQFPVDTQSLQRHTCIAPQGSQLFK
jgi:hypothetical protein